MYCCASAYRLIEGLFLLSATESRIHQSKITLAVLIIPLAKENSITLINVLIKQFQ